MKNEFYFLSKDQKKINSIIYQDFSLSLNEFFLENSISNNSFFEKINKDFQINKMDLRELLEFLCQNFSENLTKNYMSKALDLIYIESKSIFENFFIDFSKSQNIISNFNQIIDFEALKIMQISKTIPIFFDKSNEDLYILTDSVIDSKITDAYLKKFNKKRIIQIFTKKQVILDILHERYNDLLISESIIFENENVKNKRPSAKNLCKIFQDNKFKFLIGFFSLFGFCFLSLKFLIFLLFLIGGIFFVTNLFKIFISFSFLLNKEKYYFEDNISGFVFDLDYKERFTSFEKPKYTIFLPILNEEKDVIIQLIASIKEFNYPTHLLEIFILVEEDDFINQSILKSIKLDYIFLILKIPDYFPKTKAKACNFALNFAEGKFLTIYDADDIPEPNQLLYVLEEFKRRPENFKSVQCVLNSYNYDQNFLTKFYSIEYSLWFGCFLKVLNFLKMPITLGGTSNHFKTSILKGNLWDSYNVTEDADLGVLFWLKNYQISLINSKTFEEAPISIFAWIKQRSRWIKGFLQTYFTYSKFNNYSHLNCKKKAKFLIWLNLFIFFPIFCQFFSIFIPIKLLILKYFFKNVFFTKMFFKIYLFNFIFYYFGQIFILLSNSKNFLVKPNFFEYILFPFYLFLNIFATFKAVWQFFTKQYFWEKTSHGFFNTKKNKPK